MIEYLCGLPRSGKSLLAEYALIRGGGRVLYVGTLPRIRLYEEIIYAHQARRPDHWDLYECSGEPSQDIKWLTDALDRYDGMLLDGMSFYLQRALCYYDIGKMEQSQLRIFLAKAASLPIHLILVDQPLSKAPLDVNIFGRLLHEEIYHFSDTLSYVEGGVSSTCSIKFLRQIDCRNEENYGQK